MQRNDSLAVLFILSQAHRLACFCCEPTIFHEVKSFTRKANKKDDSVIKPQFKRARKAKLK